MTREPARFAPTEHAMPLTPLACPACGAPLDGSSSSCGYCGATLLGLADARWEALVRGGAELDDAADRRPWCRVGDKKLLVRGLLARGEASDVFLADTARRPTERVVLKVAREDAGRALLAREWTCLQALGASDKRGAPFMTTLLPQPVVTGLLRRGDGSSAHAAAYRWRSGYHQTLRHVRAAYPEGVGPRHAVWIWRRVLDLLGWVHASGWSHGAVEPEHALIHPRDHGAVLVGWTRARVLAGDAGKAARAEDVAASAMAVTFALGGDGALSRTPAPLGELLATVASGRVADAEDLSSRVLEAATQAFGPPAYEPFTMPGWR